MLFTSKLFNQFVVIFGEGAVPAQLRILFEQATQKTARNFSYMQ
jgi:hypothetical protein